MDGRRRYMKILIFGDMHADSRTPVSRKDDYRKTVLNKLQSLYEHCIENNVGVVVTTGDVFDRTEQSLLFLNELMDKLNLFKLANIDFYTVVGNHDLPYNSFEYFNNTPLSLLFKAGVMKRIFNDRPIELDNNIVLHGMSYTEQLPVPKDSTKINMLVMHYSTDNTVANDSISRQDLQNFKIVVSGHDHKYYPIDSTSPIILRPGSFTRLTKKAEDVERKITFYTIDTTTMQLEEHILANVLAAEDVYKSVALNTGLTYADSMDYNGIFKENYFKSDVVNIFDVVKALPISVTQETKDALLVYLGEVIPRGE